MNPLNRPKNLEDIVQEFCLLFTVFLFGLVTLAILGVFKLWLVVLMLLLFLAYVALRLYYFYSFRKVSILSWNKGILVFLIILTLFNAFYHHNLPLSRDNIGYLTAGVMLARTGKLHFQDIISRPYHPYRETNLGKDIFTSQFLPGYNSFLAFWYSLGGLSLVFWGNLILYFLFLICFYGVARNLSSPKTAFVALLFLSTFYAFLWFPRRTNSENLLMFLIWLSLWLLVKGLKKGNLRKVFSGFLPISLTLLVRGEGLLYLGAFIVAAIILLVIYRQQIRKDKKIFLPVLWVPANLLLLWRYADFYKGVYIFEHGISLFYTISDFLKVPFMVFILIGIFLGFGLFFFLLRWVVKKIKLKSSLKIQSIVAALLTLFILFDLILVYYYHNWKELINWQIYRTQFVFLILGKYFLFPYLLLFIFGLLGPRILKKEVAFCTLLLSPTVIFFLDPFVGLDQPWFLRRFFPTVIPLLFILGAIGLFNLRIPKKHSVLIFILLLLMNLWVSWPIILFRDYQGMQVSIADLASRFEKDSLILMDPGWNWQQWGYSLHYIYNCNVLPKLDGFSEEELKGLLASYPKVYVISQSQTNIFDHPLIPDQKLKYLSEVPVSYPTIVPSSNITQYVMENEDQVKAHKILAAYYDPLPRLRDIVSYDLFVYEYQK